MTRWVGPRPHGSRRGPHSAGPPGLSQRRSGTHVGNGWTIKLTPMGRCPRLLYESPSGIPTVSSTRRVQQKIRDMLSPWGEGVPRPAFSPAGAGRVRGRHARTVQSTTCNALSFPRDWPPPVSAPGVEARSTSLESPNGLLVRIRHPGGEKLRRYFPPGPPASIRSRHRGHTVSI